MPEPIPQTENTDAEARLIQAEKHHEESTALLETLIHQNEKNNPEPILETIAIQNDKTKKAIEESGEKVAKAVESVKPELSKIDEVQKTLADILKNIPMIKGDKGDDGKTPEKGKDYFTDKEIQEFKKEVTPVKGKDYNDGKDGYTPIKGKDYFDGDDGKTPVKGVDYFDGKDADETKIVKKVLKEIPKPEIPKIDGKEIVEKISSLKDDDRLSYDALKDTPFIPHPQASRDYDFLELKDVPKSYQGQANKLVKVKSDETGLEFGINQPRVVTLVDSGTVTPNANTTDIGLLLTLSQNSTIANPTGTPVNGQKLMLRIKSTSSRTLTWGSQYRGSTDLSLPTATSGSSLTDYLGFQWNSADSKWDLLAKNFGF